MNKRARNLLLLGALLVVGSWTTLFLVVLGMFSLPIMANFTLYASSAAGLFLGFLGASIYARKERHGNDSEDPKP